MCYQCWLIVVWFWISEYELNQALIVVLEVKKCALLLDQSQVVMGEDKKQSESQSPEVVPSSQKVGPKKSLKTFYLK